MTNPLKEKMPKRALSSGEFIALMASLIALVAMSIDAMLPALPAIGADLGVVDPNDNQLVVSFLLFGLGIGQLIFGPLSDGIGRKPAIYFGMGLFIMGCLASIVAPTFGWMLTGRFLQGLGVAGPRSVTTALIRDRFKGNEMARIMSFVMAVFILIPIVAPSFGQAILLFAQWRAIFGMFLLLAVLAVLWLAFRQPETLPVEKRIPFQFARIRDGFRQVLSNRITLGYTLTSGLISGAFIGYLNSAQQIFQDMFKVGTQFPLYFGGLAIASGIASLVNARLVMRLGMQRLTSTALGGLTGLSFLFGLYTWQIGGVPPFWVALVYFVIVFFAVGIIFGNTNSLAMEPLGHVAGIGAAVVGSVATLMSAPLGTWVGQAYDGTIVPLVVGFAILGAASLLTMAWGERGRGVV